MCTKEQKIGALCGSQDYKEGEVFCGSYLVKQLSAQVLACCFSPQPPSPALTWYVCHTMEASGTVLEVVAAGQLTSVLAGDVCLDTPAAVACLSP